MNHFALTFLFLRGGATRKKRESKKERNGKQGRASGERLREREGRGGEERGGWCIALLSRRKHGTGQLPPPSLREGPRHVMAGRSRQMAEGRYSIMSHEAVDADEVPSIPLSIGQVGVSAPGGRRWRASGNLVIEGSLIRCSSAPECHPGKVRGFPLGCGPRRKCKQVH